MSNIDLSNCSLCPRNCHVNRINGELGFCGQSESVSIARAALHHWEEPCISGTNGSGAVFFCGCNLKCIFCQNADLATSKLGKKVSSTQLAEIFLALQEQNAHNINLVTPGHFVPIIAKALISAKAQGLTIPVVYNTGTYEYVDTLKHLEGLIDIYLPDLKYMSVQLSQKLSNASNYFDIASKAIDEMFRQVGINIFDEAGIMQKGIIIRHLVLPGHVNDSRNVLSYIYEKYKNDVYVSIMNQYTPMLAVNNLSDLNHKLKASAYDRLIDYCIDLGYTNAYIQEGPTQDESFIPLWDYSGVPNQYIPDSD